MKEYEVFRKILREEVKGFNDDMNGDELDEVPFYSTNDLIGFLEQEELQILRNIKKIYMNREKMGRYIVEKLSKLKDKEE